jgi:hypothetical protein
MQIFEKCPNTSKKSYANFQCLHNNCVKFGKCQPRGVDNTYNVVDTVNIFKKLENWLSSTTCTFSNNHPNTSKKSHAHLQCVHDKCSKFGQCQPRSLRRVNYTILVSCKSTPIQPPARQFYHCLSQMQYVQPGQKLI